jgi:hypothetical protein
MIIEKNMKASSSIPPELQGRSSPAPIEDLHAWLLDQASALRARRVVALDWDQLAEELEAMALSDRKAIVGHLRRLLSSLLKWTYSATKRSERSWKNSILGARLDLSFMLDNSRTLKNQMPELLMTAYKQACLLAGNEMRLEKHEAQKLFPKQCPWSPEQLLDVDFIPEISPQANGRPHR